MATLYHEALLRKQRAEMEDVQIFTFGTMKEIREKHSGCVSVCFLYVSLHSRW